MSERYACTPERFAKDVVAHAMSVVRDDGTARHLMFRKPGYSAHWFEIVTWPGTLCIHGDMGTYVFSREPDMFDFFRSRGGGINPSYWAEKLQGDYGGRSDRGMEFSEELYRAAVKREFREIWRGRCKTREQFEMRRECWSDVREDLLRIGEMGDAAIGQVMGYSFQLPRGSGIFRDDRFGFGDFYDNHFHTHTLHFIWCLRAIVWGIEQYDAHHAAQAAATPEVAAA